MACISAVIRFFITCVKGEAKHHKTYTHEWAGPKSSRFTRSTRTGVAWSSMVVTLVHIPRGPFQAVRYTDWP